jgi:hypothetical protein
MTDTLTASPNGAGPAPHARRLGVGRWLWAAGLALVALALGAGRAIEDRLRTNGLPDLSSAPPQLADLAPLLFAFALPLGLALCAAAALRQSPGRNGPLPWLRFAPVAIFAVLAPVLVPSLLGREMISFHFGAGGILITVAALVCCWAVGLLRSGAPRALIPAVDLALGGLVCLVAAAWNLCGSAAMPSFLLMPERMQALDTLPFAIGQMKAVLTLLALGWVLLMCAATVAALRVSRQRTS